jgi:PKD repeat protein
MTKTFTYPTSMRTLSLTRTWIYKEWNRFSLTFLILLVATTSSFSQLAYTFSQTAGTYTPITGGTVLFSGTFDDSNSPIIAIPTVAFNGIAYTSMTVNTNGYITLGVVPPVANGYLPVSDVTAYSAAIAPFGRDLNQATTGTPEVRWEQIANEVVVQWQDVRRYNVSNEQISFQARINITSGDIRFVYGGTIIPGANTIYPEVGLRGTSNSQFLNRSVLAAGGDWINSVAGTVNTATCYFNSATPTTVPSAGLTYTFTNTSPAPTPATIISTAIGGLWNAPSTWIGGIVPSVIDDVIIGDGAVVTVNVSTAIASLTIGQSDSAILNFNASAARNLFVTNNVTVNNNATLTSIPTVGTSVRQISLGGNFINNGIANLSDPNFALSFIGNTGQALGGSGTFLNADGLGQLQVVNPAGVTLSVPIRIAFNLDLISGNLNAGSNLTFNHLIAPRVAFGGGNTIRRSPASQLIGTPTFVTDTVAISYVLFAGQTSTVINTGSEIPSSRNIFRLTLSNTAGVNLTGGSLNIFAPTTALTLTSGILNVGASQSVFLLNPSYTTFPAGSDLSHVNGSLRFRVNSTAAQTRTVPIGNGISRTPIGFGGLNTGGNNLDITVRLDGAPTGSGILPVSTSIGTRMYRVQTSGTLPATSTITLNWVASDSLLVGTANQLRVVQSPTGIGDWTERSAATGTGNIPLTGSRTTTVGVDIANGEYFAFGTVAQADASITALLTQNPLLGCYGTSETVSVNLRSIGIPINFSTTPVTITGSVLNPDLTTTVLSPITINSGTLGSSANQTINFTSPINMSAKGVYQFTFVTTGDGNATNDTLRQSVNHVGNVGNAFANPSVIPLGTASQLSFSGARLTSTTKKVRITEIVSNRNGSGQTPTYPAFAPGADLIEISNLSNASVSLSGDSILILGIGVRSYVFPSTAVIPAFGILIVHIGTGTDNIPNLYFNTGGGNDVIQSSSLSGFILKSGSEIIDAVAVNGFTFPSSSGVTVLHWSGNVPSSSGRSGISLINFDNNSASNWVIANTPSPLQTLGTINPGLIGYGNSTATWAGPSGFTATGFSTTTGPITTSGLRNYIVTITEAGCATEIDTAVLQVLPPAVPVAGFTANNLNPTIGGVVSTVTFTDTSANFPSNWKWTISPGSVLFVSGTSDSSQNPQVQFTAVGQYSVQLRVNNITGADSVLKTNYITVTGSYCSPSFPSGVEPITLVNFAGINRTTPNATGGSALLNYLSDTGTVNRGVSYPITIKGNTDGNFLNNIKAFVDWNKDFDFSDPGEEYNLGTIVNSTGIDAVQLVANILVPLNAPLGVTRIRIMKKFSDPLVGSCNTAGFGQAQDFSINVLPAPSCLIPSGLVSSNILATSATVRWNSAPPSIGYRVQYGVTGFTLGTGLTVTVTDTSANLTGLLPQTTYQFYVRNLCSTTDSSDWSFAGSFTTPCAPFALPFTETFDSTSTSVACWNAGAGWALFNVNATTTPGSSVRFNFFNIPAGTRSNLVSAPLNAASANHRLRFAHSYATFSAADIDTLIVYTSANNGNTWAQLVAIPGGATGPLNTAGIVTSSFAPTLPSQWSTFNIAIPIGTNQVRFEAVSGFGNNLFLDNITVEPIPSCPAPTSLAASAITATSATLTWSTTAANSQVQWGLSGFTLGMGTIVNVTGTTTNLTGLVNATSYQAYVRSVCAPGDTSAWTAATSFATLCSPASIPYSQNFDGVIAPALPACITLQNGVAPWFISNGTGLPITGPPLSFPSTPNAMVTVWNATLPSNSWFFTRELTLVTSQVYRLSFNYLAPGFASGENLRVTLGSTAASSTVIDTLWQRTGMLIPLATTSLADTTFTVPASGTYFIGFQTFSPADEFLIAVDNISVDIFTGMNDSELASGLSIFPNPSTGRYNIRVDNAQSNAQLIVRDLAGKQLIARSLNAESNLVEETLDMTAYAKGIYYATIINGDAVRTVKLTLE